jgi:hypothetical protein
MTKPWVVPCKAIVYSGGPFEGGELPAYVATLYQAIPVDGCGDRVHRYRRVWVSREMVAHYEYAGIWLTDDTSEEPL